MLSASSANVDTVTVRSKSMKKDIKCVVILPEGYQRIVKITDTTRYPVVYLLHGYDGWYSNWLIRVPELKKFADRYNLIIVCPDGNKSGWYVDSPIDSTNQYETHVAKEVPVYVDAHYKTIRNKTGRAITGLSMGGHGGLLLGLRHTEFFGACGSMSGAVDLQSLRNKFEMYKRLGDTAIDSPVWKEYSVFNVVENYKGGSKIIIDCGTDDFLYNANRALHAKMLTLKIPHEYIERPGKHDWAYWKNAIEVQLLFFRNFFYGG